MGLLFCFKGIFVLLAGIGDIGERLDAFRGDVLPVLGCDAVFGEELGSHSDTVYTSFDPR